MRVAVVGAGAWGTALADLLARDGHSTTIWALEPEVADGINQSHSNERYLPGHALAPTLVAHSALAGAVSAAELIVFAPPSHVLRSVARAAASAVPAGALLVVASKGIERETFALMTDVVAHELPDRPVVALSGPSFAAEVAASQPTAVVAASTDETAAERVQVAFSSGVFRVYTDRDVVGVELGGALKNVMAIAAGILEGLGLGHNARAALITRGLAEMTRLGSALGAAPATFAGLAGVGDLVLTCTGGLSRNRTLGFEIGRGRNLHDLLAERVSVAEGVINTQSARALARRRAVDMPIVDAVHRVLFEGASPSAAIGELMSRELRAEKDQ